MSKIETLPFVTWVCDIDSNALCSPRSGPHIAGKSHLLATKPKHTRLWVNKALKTLAFLLMITSIFGFCTSISVLRFPHFHLPLPCSSIQFSTSLRLVCNHQHDGAKTNMTKQTRELQKTSSDFIYIYIYCTCMIYIDNWAAIFILYTNGNYHWCLLNSLIKSHFKLSIIRQNL